MNFTSPPVSAVKHPEHSDDDSGDSDEDDIIDDKELIQQKKLWDVKPTWFGSEVSFANKIKDDEDVEEFLFLFERACAAMDPAKRYNFLLKAISCPTVRQHVTDHVDQETDNLSVTSPAKVFARCKAQYSAARTFLISTYRLVNRGEVKLDAISKLKWKDLANYQNFYLNFDRQRKALMRIDASLVSDSAVLRIYNAALPNSIHQRLLEKDDYDQHVHDLNWRHDLIVKWAAAQRAVERNNKSSKPTLNAIVSNESSDDDVDVASSGFKEKAKKPRKNAKGDEATLNFIAGACAKEDISSSHFFLWIERDDILPRNVKSCYDTDTWKKRCQHVESNGLYAEKPELYNKDMIDGKKVCVACKRVNHTADTCSHTKSGISMQALTSQRSRVTNFVKSHGGPKKFGNKLTAAIKKAPHGKAGNSSSSGRRR